MRYKIFQQCNNAQQTVTVVEASVAGNNSKQMGAQMRARM